MKTRLLIISSLILLGFVTSPFVISDAFADSDPNDDYLKFDLDGFYIYVDNKHITDISFDWNGESLPHGTVTFDEKIYSNISIMIPKNIPRTMNLDFGSSMAVFYPDTLVVPIKETEPDCFCHLRIPVNDVDEITIDSISVLAGRWESVTVNDPKCDDVYKHYSDTYKSKLPQSPRVHPVDSPVTAPLKQIKSGVALFDVKCNEGKYLVYKYNRMRTACVFDETEVELINRGWALMRFGFPDNTRTDLSASLCGSYEGKWHPEYEGCRGDITDLQCSLMGGEFVDDLKICYDGICPVDKTYTLCVTNPDLISGQNEN